MEFMDYLEAQGVRNLLMYGNGGFNSQPWAGNGGAGVTQQGGGFQSYGSSLNGQSYMGGTINSNAWAKPPAAAPSGGSGGGGNISGLLAQQMANNNQARQQNEANWTAARDHLLNVGTQYNNDATANATRNLTNQFLANPEAINNQTQQNILNRSANTINSNIQAQMQQGAGVLGAGGQLDASSIRSMQERLGRQGQSQLLDTQANLDVQRAMQRNTDFMNAAQTGRAMSAQDYGVKMGIANSYLENLPQYMPDDLSGYAAMMAGQGGGGGSGGGMGFGGGGAPGFGGGGPVQAPDYGSNGAKYRDNGNGAGFSWFDAGGNNTSYNMGTNGQGFFDQMNLSARENTNYNSGNNWNGYKR